jgi:hypothetical protein
MQVSSIWQKLKHIEKQYSHIAWKFECKKTRINDLLIIYYEKDGHIP